MSSFMRWLCKVSTVLGCGLFLVMLVRLAPEPEPAETSVVINGIKVVAFDHIVTVDIPNWRIKANPTTSERCVRYLQTLQGELDSYPTELFRKAGLRRIVVCSKLALNDRVYGGTADSEHGVIYLQIPDEQSDSIYLRMAVHHEFFHLLDFALGHFESDPAWETLNVPGFRYGAGGETMLDDPLAGIPDPLLAGFINKYSTSGLAEDKAEVFAYMMVAPLVLEARLPKDGVLWAKRKTMEFLLQEISPTINCEFWRAIRERE
jgi:hypothetical protein